MDEDNEPSTSGDAGETMAQTEHASEMEDEENEPSTSGEYVETEAQTEHASEMETDKLTHKVVKKLSSTRSVLVDEPPCPTRVDGRTKPRRPVPRSNLTRFKVIGDEVTYKTDCPRMNRRMAGRPPVVLQRHYLKQVIQKMRDVKMNKPKKRQHKMFEEYGESGEMALLKCTHPSIEKVINNFSPISAYRCTIDTIFRRIRYAMLDKFHLQSSLTSCATGMCSPELMTCTFIFSWYLRPGRSLGVTRKY
jgi:hypothetical protein